MKIFRPLALVSILFFVAESAGAACSPPFSKLIRNGGYGVADTNGKLISSCNPDKPYVPASVLKLATALAAFDILGPDYRFTTAFYTDRKKNLYIKGTGDPMLVSEEIREIFRVLQEKGVKEINAIYIDPSAFALEYRVPGREDSDNPYDAPIGAVSVNFNSVAVRVTKKGEIRSGEEETPLLPLMETLGKGYPAGRHRINICRGGKQPEAQVACYTTELFRVLQEEAGIAGRGETGIRLVPADAELIYTHQGGKNLKELASSFLKYSSNFISNLVYLACGAKKYGYPATWAKAERAVNEVLIKRLGKKTAAAIVQKEGAGLFRGNRVTVRAMLELLKVFRPHASLLRNYMGVPTKSGSMKGIYNYAGYLNDGRAYVILLNQQRNQRRAVLGLLKKGQYPGSGKYVEKKKVGKKKKGK
ncbi:D-alanyl-D-alanine carboxypeptidase; D-alanyl-D-alanine-endopeptidase (penicillin-binding protein 4) [Candidatus Electrothrix marina]|uniref:D-alanyl-D-alanine carboxypeptidase n=2 Tax=Candidatus Electrothrix marina TaxID=1859130 RepID=A0A444IUH5_9BACT|nr:D-alanyl-D-alanine carboxypeptidase; D-alanyl-D-alanine-endopeptidase (penicillin-binding protein 4) [Candidatus Electrothrix marina]